MSDELNIFNKLHKQTRRDYLGRMQDDKVTCMKVAKQYGAEFWDGDRRYGYGGYRYDGRWKTVAQDLIDHYGLQDGSSVLDVGCGKGFLLYEFQQLLPNARLAGFDISQYALNNARAEIKGQLFRHQAQEPYPFEDQAFDLVISLTTLHNLPIQDLKPALQEIERVGRQKYICVESYGNEAELFALQCWALTAEAFFSYDSWRWIFREFGYTGDYEFICFE